MTTNTEETTENTQPETDALNAATIQQEVIAALRDMGMMAEAAQAVVEAIHDGQIPHVKIIC